MSATPSSVLTRADLWRLAGFTVVLCVVVPAAAWFSGGFEDWSAAGWRPRLDFAPFRAASAATRIHALVILLLVLVGLVLLGLPKGDRRHRAAGWTWIAGLGLMGAASLAVPHGSSWIAAYVGGGSALVLAAVGLVFARLHHARLHGRTMAMLMIALVLMTLLSVTPGRLMHAVLFGP